MSFVSLLAQNKLKEAKEFLYARLDEIVQVKLQEVKEKIAADRFEEIEIDEEVLDEKRNPNIVRMGRIQRIRRRVRRNAKGRIVVQKNVKRSAIKGYKISGSTVKRIPTAARLKKARLLKRAWKTTRRAKLRRTLLKRKMSMRRRASMGLR